MGQSNTVELSGNCIALGPETRVGGGLDVHKKKVDAALALGEGIVATWVMPARPEAICKTLRPLPAASTVVAYEAGPTGFELARALRKEGFEAIVAAPGKTPRPANPPDKSDRLDCRQPARFAYNGLLRPVAVPTRREEADRQVMRLHEQIKKKLRRVQQQIKSLLLQYGIEEPEGLSCWSETGIEALEELEAEPELQFTLQMLVGRLRMLGAQKKRAEKRLRQMARRDRYRREETLLETIPGVGILTAMHFLLEIHQPERFEGTEQVAGYVGLAPRVSQSGQRRREGSRVPGGRPELRAMLAGASWQWVDRDEGARRTYRRLVPHYSSAVSVRRTAAQGRQGR